MNQSAFRLAYPVLVALASICLMGGACSKAPLPADSKKVGGDAALAAPNRLNDCLDLIPAKWAVLQIKIDQAESFFMRLPKVQGWSKKFDRLQKVLPQDAFSGDLEAERAKCFDAIHTEIAVACSSKTLAKIIVQMVSPFPMLGPAQDLDALLRQASDVEFRRALLATPTEIVNISTRETAFGLSKNLPSASEVDRVGNTPILRFDLEFLAEPQPGILLGASSLPALKRALQDRTPGMKRPGPNFAYDAVLHLPPDFVNDEVWPKLFSLDLPRKDGKQYVGDVWVGAKVLKDGLRIQVQANIIDDSLLEKAKVAANAANSNEERKPFVKKSDIRFDGRTLCIAIDVEDGFVDQLLPTDAQIGQWLAVSGMFRRAGHR